MKKKVGVLGATGYTGYELLKRLAIHSKVEIVFASSRTYEGQKIGDIFPDLREICDIVLENPNNLTQYDLDVLFCALPHNQSAVFIKEIYDKIPLIIDLSADFRLDEVDSYQTWYNFNHPAEELLDKKVYGLVELYREQIKNAKLIANPGCYPTSIILALAPILKNKLFNDIEIIIDSKSSISGAGRSLKYGNLFVEMNENLYAYNAGHKHRHISEIEQEIKKLGELKDVYCVFTPQVVPINRGILSNIYINLTQKVEKQDLIEIYKNFYKNDFFVRVLDTYPQISGVRYTNFCDIGFEVVGGNRVLIMSAIDNIVKGASGQAIQNMNIALGFDEKEGLL